MQQTCRFLSKSFSIFACYAVEGVIINVVIQSRSVIVRLNLASYLILFLIITKWLIMDELKKLSNYTLRNLKTMIFIKNWVLNHCFFWDSIMPFLWLLHTLSFNLLQLSVNLIYLFNSFIEIMLARGALLHTLPPFQDGNLKLFW